MLRGDRLNRAPELAKVDIVVLRRVALMLMLLVAACPNRAAAQAVPDEPGATAYFPDTAWQHKNPSEAGINPKLLKEAVDLAIAGETKAPRDLAMSHYETFGREPFSEASDPSRTGAIRPG